MAFIEGRHIAMKLLERNWKPNGYNRLPEPSPAGAIVYKLCITTGSLILFLSLTKALPIVYIADDKFINKASFLKRLSYAYIAMQAARPKYYFAWTLGKCYILVNAF
ncbi:UNVERIFIED_CONTAM: hypothetical protein FKN15_043673 [Acipenser sinensis]